MPNWSYNTLKVTGSPDKMNEFYSQALKVENESKTFKFKNLFPMPEKIKNTISPSSSAKGKLWMNEDVVSVNRDIKISELVGLPHSKELIPCENNTPEKCEALKKEYGADNWYDWNILTYGTKWDVDVDEMEIEDEEFIACFDTAWSPPANFIYKLQQKFPDLDISLSYEIEGDDQCGLFYTERSVVGNLPEICHETDELIYKSGDGRDIYFNDDEGEWYYHDDNEICEDYVRVNPFN